MTTDQQQAQRMRREVKGLCVDCGVTPAIGSVNYMPPADHLRCWACVESWARAALDAAGRAALATAAAHYRK